MRESGKNLTEAVSEQRSKTCSLPIVVDLDGTLVLSDTLEESVVLALFRRPAALMKTVPTLLRSRLAFKEALAREIDLSEHSLPLRDDLVSWLYEQAEKGHEIHICSAAHQSIVEAFSRRIGFCTSAVGSTSTNLKGDAKADYLKARFPEGFIYVGDHAADLPVWEASEGIVLAGASAGVTGKAVALGKPVLKKFAAPPLTLREVFHALRVHHWTKNILLFVPLILAHQWSNLHIVWQTLCAFTCLLAVTSGTYLLNDIADINSDRQHWSKRHRAMASGRMPLRSGMLLAVILILIGLAAAFMLSLAFFATLLAYLVLTSAYSLKLKSIPLLDTLVISVLFTLRLVMGVVLLQTPKPAWLLTFGVFFFFSLATAKRHTEIVRAGTKNTDSLQSRGYVLEDGPLTLALGTSAAIASLVVLFIFIIMEMLPGNTYRHPEFLSGIPAMLSIWLGRIWLLSHRGLMNDDPVNFAVRDRTSLVLGALVAILFFAAL
jgi:4-hydroxybenzoate polyprenyltransferase/phosphoserine phosphatase